MNRRQTLQLNRTFSEFDVSGGEEGEPEALVRIGPRVSWPQLLAERCIVLLGEAGTGKSTEFKLQCQTLIDTGAYAFYVPVEQVAVLGSFEASLGAAEQASFAAWKRSTERAHFFLDAVDEARLVGHSPTAALRKVEQALQGAMVRAHVLISCRVSDWRADSDLEEVVRILFPDRKPTSPIPVKVYAISPLDDVQVAALAASVGVPDSKRFVQEARRAGASSFLERPRDVDWMAGYWRQHHAFGTLTELIENNIREKLLERNDKRLPMCRLAPLRARKAASLVAAATILERKATIRLPDASLDAVRSATTLDPAHVLPDLPPPEVAELLTLAVFDEATYGRVRIHLRSVTDYLAAEWFRTLLEAGLAVSELESLLFMPGPEGTLVPAELAAVAAWLAGDYQWVRDRLIDVEPAALLQGGDPNRLPDESRRALLVSLARRYVGRRRLYKRFHDVELGLLASAGIVDTVNDLLRTSTQDELLDMLLTIVSEGRLAGCVNEVLGLAMNATASSFVRSEAVRVLSVIGSERHIETLLKGAVDVALDIDHGLAGAVIETLHPRWVSTDRVITLITKARGPTPQRSSLLTYFLKEKVPRNTPEADRARLLQAMLDLVRIEGDPKSVRRSWLLGPLAAMTSVLSSSAGFETILPVFRLFAGLAGHGRLEPGLGHDDIQKLIADRADLRRLLFWDDVATVERDMKNRVRRYYDVRGTERLWKLTTSDAGWLAEDARSRPAIYQRLLAFDTLMLVIPTSTEREQLLADLSASDKALQKHLDRYNRRATTGHHDSKKWERIHRVHEAQERRQRQENLDWLSLHLDDLASGREQYALVRLAVQSHLDGEDPEAALGRISEKYNDDVASATREGWRRLWRQLRAKLPHEEEQRNTIDYSVIVGLAGLTLDIAAGLDLSSLTHMEARNAVGYASRGMNHFPAWVELLANAQPVAVTEIFGECISADYALAVDAPAPHAVMHLLSHAPPVVRELCWRIVTEHMANQEPPRLDTLKDCVDLVIATPLSRVAVAGVVPVRCRDSRGNRERYALWWSLWLVIDAAEALTDIEIATREGDAVADELVLVMCDTVWRLADDRRIGYPFPVDAPALVRLASIVFRHVRPDDDLQHEGAHIIGPRDHAQSLRDYLINRVATTPGEDAYNGLKALAKVPSLLSSQEMLLALAAQRLAQDTGSRVVNVAQRLVRAYRTYGLEAADRLGQAARDAARNIAKDTDMRKDMRHANLRNPDIREGTEFPAAIVFVLVDGLKDCSDAPKIPNALRALNETLSGVYPDAFALSTLVGVIVVLPDTASWSMDEILRMLDQSRVGFALRVGVTHGTVEAVRDIDEQPNLIGPPINIAARLATSPDNSGVLVHESYVHFVEGTLGAEHWLHRSLRAPVTVAGKSQDPPFLCFRGPQTFVAKSLEQNDAYPSHAAVLIAYDLPKFSAGDRSQLRKRFTRLAQVFQKLRQSAPMHAATALLSPGGDGGVLVLEGMNLADAVMIATRLQELSEIESLDHDDAIVIAIRIGVHYGPVVRYMNARGVERPTGVSLFVADEIAGDEYARSRKGIILTSLLADSLAGGSSQRLASEFERLPQLIKGAAVGQERFVKIGSGRMKAQEGSHGPIT